MMRAHGVILRITDVMCIILWSAAAKYFPSKRAWLPGTSRVAHPIHNFLTSLVGRNATVAERHQYIRVLRMLLHTQTLHLSVGRTVATVVVVRLHAHENGVPCPYSTIVHLLNVGVVVGVSNILGCVRRAIETE